MAVSGLILLAACDQNMTDQQKIESYEETALFPQGTGMLDPVPGTLAREQAASSPSMPERIDRALLARGRERFGIFCTPCHGAVGDGQGMIVARGFPQPPSFHIDRLRDAPARHFYDVVTDGYGVMYSYGARIPEDDRWAIVAHIRALQLSQNASVADLPPDIRSALEREAGP
ncbi:c-type cytochrome [Marinivivus vitaminiproducens]|uniref:c-type cytochrome n=1 Tax=Marinivivus vitaminiproducens TaxID=3035935 RepID=UPI00279DB1CB|nr:cytochrome c [Geminicoccaceae bacterium SCSIO 64248]